MEKFYNLAKNIVMKNSLLYLSIILILAVAALNTGCYPDDPGPQFPVYNYTDSIIHPPDIFQVLYNISYVGDKQAHITFKDDAVWFIQRLGEAHINYWAVNDTGTLTIVYTDTLGLKAGYTYIFTANNNNYTEFNNFFTQFNKLAIDYDTFEPKF